MEKWVIAAKRADFNQIGQQFHIDPVIARLIRNRDVIGEDKIREYLSVQALSLSQKHPAHHRHPVQKQFPVPGMLSDALL